MLNTLTVLAQVKFLAKKNNVISRKQRFLNMAAKHKKQNNLNTFSPLRFYNNYLNYEYLTSLLFNPVNLFPVACGLVFLECVINLLVINYVNYTEIDWKAYMQEVEGVLNGTFDYSLLKGDTGPLVYPAGFVWIYAGLYYVTNRGENILLAQYIFAALYVINLILVLRIYLKAKKLPPYVIILTCLTSYRIHSIFALRLFNDPVAVVLLYASINAFLDSKWHLGSFLFSLAVSVKMNILLYSPALLLTYLMCLGLVQTIHQLAICAGVQIAVALPFLLTHPLNYLFGAFNFGRVFLYEWTVNWKCLPEEIFLDKKFHIRLLVAHIMVLGVFYKPCVLYLRSFAKLKELQAGIKSLSKGDYNFDMNTSSQLFLLPMFLSNFIGVAFSRSLHFQFYIWYFHTLPFLVWSTPYSIPQRLCLLGIIEMCWNTFPSTFLSSASLHFCHASILFGVYRTLSKLQQKVSQARKKKSAKN